MIDLHDNPTCLACAVFCQLNSPMCRQTPEHKLSIVRAEKKEQERRDKRKDHDRRMYEANRDKRLQAAILRNRSKPLEVKARYMRDYRRLKAITPTANESA